MNYEGIGISFARIQPKNPTRAIRKSDTTPIYMASFEERGDIEYPITDVHVHPDEIVQPMPYADEQQGITRQVTYVSAPSGSGKSFFVGKYLAVYRKMYPKRPIYVISLVAEDKAIDEVKGVTRLILDTQFMQTEWTADKFAESCVVMDDALELCSKELLAVLRHIRSLILTTGRHHSTAYIETSHNTNNGHATKLILLESTSIVLYPHSTGHRTLKYCLETAFGFSKAEIERIKSLPSRWVMISKLSPRVIVYEGGCYTI